MTEKWSVATSVDARGTIYPVPIFRAKKALDGLAPGEIIEVLATDPNSRPDLETWATRANAELLGIEDKEDHYRFYVRKGAA